MSKEKLTRLDIAAVLRKQFGLSSADSSAFVFEFFNTINELVSSGNQVKFQNFGTFKVVDGFYGKKMKFVASKKMKMD